MSLVLRPRTSMAYLCVLPLRSVTLISECCIFVLNYVCFGITRLHLPATLARARIIEQAGIQRLVATKKVINRGLNRLRFLVVQMVEPMERSPSADVRVKRQD